MGQSLAKLALFPLQTRHCRFETVKAPRSPLFLNIDVGKALLRVPQHIPVAGDLSQVDHVTELLLLKSQILQVILIAVNHLVQNNLPGIIPDNLRIVSPAGEHLHRYDPTSHTGQDYHDAHSPVRLLNEDVVVRIHITGSPVFEFIIRVLRTWRDSWFGCKRLRSGRRAVVQICDYGPGNCCSVHLSAKILRRRSQGLQFRLTLLHVKGLARSKDCLRRRTQRQILHPDIAGNDRYNRCRWHVNFYYEIYRLITINRLNGRRRGHNHVRSASASATLLGHPKETLCHFNGIDRAALGFS